MNLFQGFSVAQCLKTCSHWDECKSQGLPINCCVAGQNHPPAVRSAMVCSSFACPFSAAFNLLLSSFCFFVTSRVSFV